MGLTKEYLRYAPSSTYNIIASSNCNIKFVTLEGQEGRFVAAGACENIIIWDLRLGEKAQVLSGDKNPVSCLSTSPNGCQLAAGYADGTIQIFDLKSCEVVSIFSGHRSEVTTLAYDAFGHKLASGAKDTDVIVWDTVAEAGVCRLSGHKGPLTQVAFMSECAVLISAAKDGFVKLWDLDTTHCFRTIIGHRSEVWAACLMKSDRYLVTGCGDAELRVWQLLRPGEKAPTLSAQLELADLGSEESSEDDFRLPLRCVQVGSLLRAGRGRVVSMEVDTTGSVLTCHGTDYQVEMFYFLTDEEAESRRKKRLKKELKKKDQNEEAPSEEISPDLTLRDTVRRLPAIKLSDKPKSMDLVLGGGHELRLVISLASNLLELYTLPGGPKGSKTPSGTIEPRLLRSIRSPGHRGEIRAVAFSSDNLAVASGGSDGIKLWNRPSQVCLRTVATDKYVVSLCFAPGDRHLLAGLKTGQLLIVDITVGEILEEILAHVPGELWSVVLVPDMRGCVSGGGDKTVKWWQFELIRDEDSDSNAKVLSLLHTRTLALEEAVLCVRMTPNDRFVAVALLDSTVKVFYADTFKLHVSLYGHKLPVLCLDISADSRLIVTGSADRNMKIWGLDFGDCHKSLFAHDDSITAVQFVGKSHLVFTCGKDGSVREWDTDNFQRIVTLPAHKGEAWSLAVSPDGRHVASCGSDRVLRAFIRTEEPLVLEDEREEERAREEAAQLAVDTNELISGTGPTLATRRTVGSEQAADTLLECLTVCATYRDQLAEHSALQAASSRPLPAPVPPPLMLAFRVNTPEDLLLETLKRIRSSEMEEALLLLPFNAACQLLQQLPGLLTRASHTEMVCRTLIFLLRVHHAPLLATEGLLPLLKKVQKVAFGKVIELRDMVGYNLHGLQYLQRGIETAEGVQLFRDASRDKRSRDKKRKQRERVKRSIMVLNG